MAYTPKNPNVRIKIDFRYEVIDILANAREPLTRDQIASRIRQRTGRCYGYASMRVKLGGLVFARVVYQLYKGARGVVYWRKPSHPKYMTNSQLNAFLLSKEKKHGTESPEAA